MKIIINGKEEHIERELTIPELLTARNVESPDMVAVELNGVILSRSELPVTRVRENDRVELLYFMGGG